MSDSIKKPTKREHYNTLLDIIATMEDERFELNAEGITYNSLREFIEHEIELLDGKAEAARKRAEEKRVEGDALREKIYDVLSDTDYMTIGEIRAALNDPDVSEQMITSRLTQIAPPKDNRVEKTTVSYTATEGGKTKRLSAYRRVN